MEAPPLVSNPADDARPEIIGSTLSLTLVAIIVMAARTWVRSMVVKNFGWDDALMLIATIGTAATEGVILAEVHYGHGRHIGDVPPNDYATGMMLNYVTQPMVFVFVSLIKLSVGASLLRIANKGGYKWLIIGVMGLTIFYTIGAFITIVVQCRPISLNWDPTGEGSCWPPQTAQALAYTSIALNIATDLLFALGIPVPMLFKLQMNRRTKIALIGVFALGTLACVAAIVRLGYLTSYGVRDDWLWDARNLSIWTMVEACLGIIAGSMPSLRPVFKRVIETTNRYASGGKTTGQNAPYGAGGSRGGTRGSKFWRSLGSRSAAEPHVQLDDDAGSEHAINVAKDSYVMQDFSGEGAKGGAQVVVGGASSHSSDSVDETEVGRGRGGDGITKTTTTTFSFQSQAYR